jgi:hypothetical protein
LGYVARLQKTTTSESLDARMKRDNTVAFYSGVLDEVDAAARRAGERVRTARCLSRREDELERFCEPHGRAAMNATSTSAG